MISRVNTIHKMYTQVSENVLIFPYSYVLLLVAKVAYVLCWFSKELASGYIDQIYFCLFFILVIFVSLLIPSI